jgi:hypothetical protein
MKELQEQHGDFGNTGVCYSGFLHSHLIQTQERDQEVLCMEQQLAYVHFHLMLVLKFFS